MNPAWSQTKRDEPDFATSVKTKDKARILQMRDIWLKGLIYYTSLFRAVKDFAESSKNYRLTAQKWLNLISLEFTPVKPGDFNH